MLFRNISAKDRRHIALAQQDRKESLPRQPAAAWRHSTEQTSHATRCVKAHGAGKRALREKASLPGLPTRGIPETDVGEGQNQFPQVVLRLSHNPPSFSYTHTHAHNITNKMSFLEYMPYSCEQSVTPGIGNQQWRWRVHALTTLFSP